MARLTLGHLTAMKLFPVILLLLTPLAHASVYRCTIDGVTTFSQTPCAETAEKLSQYDMTPTPAATMNSKQNVEVDQDRMQQISANVRKQNLQRELQRLTNREASLKRELNAKLSAITGDTINSPDDVMNRPFPIGMAHEINDTNKHYRDEIRKIQQQANKVNKELQEL